MRAAELIAGGGTIYGIKTPVPVIYEFYVEAKATEEAPEKAKRAEHFDPEEVGTLGEPVCR